MRRIMLRIAYDGTNYVGWQLQPNGLAVEEVVNKALSQLTGENIAVIGASRTDSGVHAMGNVAVFDTESRIPAEKFCHAVNSFLPDDIVVQESCEVAGDFHPRYADCNKTYEYMIYNAEVSNPLTARYSYFCHGELDTAAMREAAKHIVGEHDFAAFCSAGAQVKTTVRTVYAIDIISDDASAAGDRHGMITIRVRGNGFLYNMVRIIAGTLIQVGKHALEPAQIEHIIAGKDRSKAGPTAPAQGLRLVKIEYTQ